MACHPPPRGHRDPGQTTEPPRPGLRQGTVKIITGQSARCHLQPMLTPSEHKQDTSGAEPRVTFWIVTQFCLLQFQSRGPAAEMLAKPLFLWLEFTVLTSLLNTVPWVLVRFCPRIQWSQPTLLIELSSNIGTKKQCWLRRSFAQRANSEMKIQVEFLCSILFSKVSTAEEGVLTQKIQFKS